MRNIFTGRVTVTAHFMDGGMRCVKRGKLNCGGLLIQKPLTTHGVDYLPYSRQFNPWVKFIFETKNAGHTLQPNSVSKCIHQMLIGITYRSVHIHIYIYIGEPSGNSFPFNLKENRKSPLHSYIHYPKLS